MKDYLMRTIVVLCVLLLFIEGVKSVRSQPDDTQFQFVVTDSMMSVYNNDVYVGTVRVQGQLDSLLVDYNQ